MPPSRHNLQPGRGLMNEIETFYGLVENTLDALRIFQLCREGRLQRVQRRLHERERHLIRSGSVFVFDEEESGIKRWTDGRLWSPSRILGNFLIYRELERKSLYDARATGRSKHVSRQGDMHAQAASQTASQSGTQPLAAGHAGTKRAFLSETGPDSFLPTSPPSSSPGPIPLLPKTVEDDYHAVMNVMHILGASSDDGFRPGYVDPRQLGPDAHCDTDAVSSGKAAPPLDPISDESLSLLKSKKLINNHKGRYLFKANGFIKKTISIHMDGHAHHLVAYYSLEDFCRGHLQLSELISAGLLEAGDEEPIAAAVPVNDLPFDPQLMEQLRMVPVPLDLMIQQNFRKPAALLASAAAAESIEPEGTGISAPDREKLITALEMGVINPNDLASPSASKHTRIHGHKASSTARPSRPVEFFPSGGIIFSGPCSHSSTAPSHLANANANANANAHTARHILAPIPRPRRHSTHLASGLAAALQGLDAHSQQLYAESPISSSSPSPSSSSETGELGLGGTSLGGTSLGGTSLGGTSLGDSGIEPIVMPLLSLPERDNEYSDDLPEADEDSDAIFAAFTKQVSAGDLSAWDSVDAPSRPTHSLVQALKGNDVLLADFLD